MALSVATNVGALSATKAASSVNKSMETSMARLASGKRINSAADDSAGLAIASRLTAESRGLDMAARNAADAQALLNTIESAHNEVNNILQRMRELAVQGSNDTNGTADRTNIRKEGNDVSEKILEKNHHKIQVAPKCANFTCSLKFKFVANSEDWI